MPSLYLPRSFFVAVSVLERYLETGRGFQRDSSSRGWAGHGFTHLARDAAATAAAAATPAAAAAA